MIKWPLVWRSTYEAERRKRLTEAAHKADLERALAAAQIELHKARMLIAGRSGVLKVMKEPVP